jgi:hypothetical protein
MTHHHVHPRSFGTLTDISTARQKIANHIYLRIERHDTSHPFSCRFDVSIGFFFCSLFQFHITNTTSNVRRTLKLQSITQNKLLNRERERERDDDDDNDNDEDDDQDEQQSSPIYCNDEKSQQKNHTNDIVVVVDGWCFVLCCSNNYL